MHFIVTHLPDYHLYIQRQDTSTFLVYENGMFTHQSEKAENHIFKITYDGAFFTLKAVNHKYTDGSGSGQNTEDIESETKLRDTDCYLGFNKDGEPICHPENMTETGEFFDVLFFSNCFS